MAQNTAPTGFVPFTGELDKPTANTAPPGFVPFTGELDAPKRTIAAALNDTVIEAANAAVGGVSSAANFVKPGNAASKWLDTNFIKPGEESQSDVVKAEKQRLRSDIESATGIGDEDGAHGWPHSEGRC